MSTDTITLRIAQLRLDGGTQARAAVSEEVVAEYAAAVKAGDDLDAVGAVYDGAHYWLWDGFHRVAAHARAGRSDIAVEVRQGTRRDAVLLSCGANSRHGLRRTSADKRRAVETLLRDAEWAQWSNREIARRSGVSKGLVDKVRRELVAGGEVARPTSRIGGDGKVYTVPTKEADPWQVGVRIACHRTSRALVRRGLGAQLVQGTHEVIKATESYVELAEVGKSGKPKMFTACQYSREAFDVHREHFTFTAPPEPAPAFPEGCTAAKARIEHATGIADPEKLSAMLEVKGLQKSAHDGITRHLADINRTRAESDRAALIQPLRWANNAPGKREAIYRRLEALADGTTPLDLSRTDAELITAVEDIDDTATMLSVIRQKGVPRAVLVRAVALYNVIDNLNGWYAPEETAPGVLRAHERAKAADARKKEKTAANSAWVSASCLIAVEGVPARIEAAPEVEQVKRWFEKEQRNRKNGREGVRTALAEHFIAAGEKLSPCPACVACWAPSSQAWCPGCNRMISKAQADMDRLRADQAAQARAQTGGSAPAEAAGGLLAAVEALPRDSIQRRQILTALLREEACYDPTEYLLQGELDDVRDALADFTRDDLDELRELMVVGEIIDADLHLCGEIRDRYAALAAPDVVPVASGEPLVAWSTGEEPNAYTLRAMGRLFGFLETVAGLSAPPSWLRVRQPVLEALLTWHAAGAPRPTRPEPAAESAEESAA